MTPGRWPGRARAIRILEASERNHLDVGGAFGRRIDLAPSALSYFRKGNGVPTNVSRFDHPILLPPW